MKKLIYILIATISGIQVLAQIQVADTSVYDTIFHTNPSIGVQQLYGIQRDIETKSETGDIAVYVANAEEEHIIGAKVQIMEGERQVAFGITDCYGTLCFSRIQTGNYDVKICHIAAGEHVFHVQVEPNTETELRVVMESTTMMCLLPLTLEYPIVEREPIPVEGCKTKSPMKGGLKVFITNAERDDVIGAVVQVMDGERQVAGGIADFTGFLYIPNIEAGTYTIVISHVSVGKTQYLVRIPENEVFRLKVELRCITCCCHTVMEESIIQDPFVTSYTSDQVLRTP